MIKPRAVSKISVKALKKRLLRTCRVAENRRFTSQSWPIILIWKTRKQKDPTYKNHTSPVVILKSSTAVN